MTINKLYIFILFNIFIFFGANGQEIHFSQFELTPTLVNPALTGQFAGTYRASGVYRDQNRNDRVHAYKSFGLTIDVPVVRGLRAQDWIGAGIMLGGDEAGSGAQKISLLGMNAAYHLSLDKKQTQIVSLGVQFTAGSISYDSDIDPDSKDYYLNTEIYRRSSTLLSKLRSGGGGSNNNSPTGSLSDLQVGLLYNARGKNSDFKIGASVDGLLSPNRAVIGNSEDTKSIGINAMVEYTQPFSKRSYFIHRLFYYAQDGASAINANSRIHYKINPESDYYLIGGLGTRSLRSAQIYAGVKKGSWTVGLAYDLDLGNSTEITGGHHAIELGVSFLGIINKRPTPDPIIYCPRI